MASLHNLLSEDGFPRRKPSKKVNFKRPPDSDNSIALPIYICHDRRSFDSSRQRADKSSSRSLRGKDGGSGLSTPRRDEPAIDDVAIKAMIGILSGYIGQYLKDKNFRLSMREKCRCCFKKGSNNEILAHMELGIQSIEKMVDLKTENMDLESLQKSIKIMNIVASLDSDTTLSASAHLYLSIIYKIAKNDKISARHLLQVFSDSPFLARKHLLVELWDHFFLPHLLHLKIWFNKELEVVANSGYSDKDRRIKALKQQYNKQMDIGTALFANYYKEWLKVGAQAPPIPTVPLPSKSRVRRKSTDSSTSHHSVTSKSLYQAVFGKEHGSSRSLWDLDAESEEDFKITNHVQKKSVHHRRASSQSHRTQKSLELKSSELWQDNIKPDYFRFLGCRSDSIARSYIPSNDKIKSNEDIHLYLMNTTDVAISTVCSSQSLADCEAAVRTISEAWLNSHNPDIETSLSRASFIQGILEVLYVSNDDEVLELAISILAEVASQNEANRQCILSADVHLDVAMRLMRSNTLFLKAAALLYVMKPKARQMVSDEWIPLFLRVMEFGDQLQILFSVRCSPHEAAYYFLNQLLTGYDEDKNLQNAKQLVSLGGLSLIVRRMEVGDTLEKCRAASVLCFCIRGDGSCRHYLVKNLKKESVLSLLVLEKQSSSRGHSLELVAELLCLSRRKQRMEYLTGLAKGWNGINALQILLLRLQRARPEERPVVAVLLLQLDLMGDALEHSVYREEAIDAIVKALDCWVFDEKTQEETARALLILGGYFSYTGEPEIERCLLRKAGFQENTENSFYGHFNSKDEDKTSENWERKTAMILLKSGNRRLLSALSDSIANSIPCLARASLVNVCWITSYLHSIGDTDLQLDSCSILVSHLIHILTHDARNLQDKILASFALHSLTKGTDYLSTTCRLQEDVLSCLEKLSLVTWTAKELISHATTNSMDQFL